MKTMKFVGFALIAVLASVGFTACGGDDGDSGGGAPSGKQLVKMTEELRSNTYVYEFTYDSQGRVVKANVTRNGLFDRSYSYEYYSNSITRTRTSASGGTSKIQYTLENGCIVKEIHGNSSEIVQYTYNDGYMATKTITSYGSTSPAYTYTYSWSNGNLVSESRSHNGHTDLETCEYTNYIAPAMCVNFWDTIEVDLIGYYGKTSRNLPSKFIDHGAEELTYEWTMSGGLPVKLIITESNDDDISIITFEWK